MILGRLIFRMGPARFALLALSIFLTVFPRGIQWIHAICICDLHDDVHSKIPGARSLISIQEEAKAPERGLRRSGQVLAENLSRMAKSVAIRVPDDSGERTRYGGSKKA